MQPGRAAAYRAPRWLRGAHLQTIVPAKLVRRPRPDYRRERWEATPLGRADGDFIEVDWIDAAAPTTPIVVMFHGLEGSSASHYATALMARVGARGWRGAVAHFRGCGGAPNLAPRFYHSGDSDEIDWILRRMRVLFPDAPLYAVGVSLGGNVLLKWLGEGGATAGAMLRGAAAISAPVDLAAGGIALASGFNRLYTRMFLNSLKPKCEAKLRQYPGLFDAAAMRAARDLHDFDDVVTAPLHGFRDADDYYRRASSKPLLRGIALPTLLLNARNDPFLPAAALPGPAELSASVLAEFPDEGGHVGFLAGHDDGADWLARRTLNFLENGH